MNKKELKELALADLKRSGLDAKDFNKMKLVVCDEEEAETVLNSPFCTFGYALPYFDANGKMIENVRFRFLEELYNDKHKVVKYSQPKGTPPKLYFPPCIKWKDILKDKSITLTFVEGEKKAYTACKAGIPTIGLGGVWSFKSKRLQKNLIDDFKQIVLKDRKVLLCFDNDSHTNDDIMKALRAFAKELDREGAIPLNKVLPFNPYQKIGLDDFLLTNSVTKYNKLEELPFESITHLAEMNDEVAYIESLGKFYLINNKLFVNDSHLKNISYSNKLVPNEQGQDVSAAVPWLQWPNRRTHEKLTYLPAQPRVTKDNEFNLWGGWGCIPEKGSVKPFLDAVKQIFDNDKALITWFLDWVAYPIQHPATKMLTAVLLQSIAQGTGKSSLGLCIGAMYGDNYALVDDNQLHNSFNEWAVNKQFVLGDEVSGKDKRSESDGIKNLITRPNITINKKYEPTYSVPDCINYLFTSNHPDALSIEPDDRRIFVYRVKSGNGLSLKQGQLLEIFRNGTGKSYLLNYFINEYKISKGFNHQARPPMTDAKSDLIDNSLTDIERWLQHLKDNPKHVLTIDGAEIDRDLYTTAQLVSLYQRTHTKANVSNTAMGKAINKIFGEVEVTVIRTLSGTQRVRALRNFEKWDGASSKDKAEHFDKSKIALFVAKKAKFKKEVE